MIRNCIHKEITDSTSNDISRLALAGAPEGTVVVADMQTAGKGRRGRSWETESGTSLLFSLLLRPTIAPDTAPQLTLLMAMAVTKVIRELTGLSAQIKWPNDVVVNAKKVCGILTEMRLKDSAVDYVVVGTGVNVNQTSIPVELENSATSLLLEKIKQVVSDENRGARIDDKTAAADCEERFDKEGLLDAILRAFEEYYERFLQTEDLTEMMSEYNKWLVSLDKEVKVLDPKGEFTGISKGINEKGELLVELPDGEVKAIYAGEVSVRGLYGYV